jgi:5'-deoxynucleotidase YfbR-like HD superfamily hydrolase
MSILIATPTGLVDLAAPDLARITPRAMAHTLARLNRWAGNTELPVTDAQHSVLVREIFVRLHPELRSQAIHPLLHDGHEYLLGDLTRPFQQALEQRLPGFVRHVEAIKGETDAAIRSALGLPEPSMDVRAAIHEADRLAAAIEWLSFIDAANGPCPYGNPPRGLPTRVKALSWPAAEEQFLAHLERDLAERAWEARAA